MLKILNENKDANAQNLMSSLFATQLENDIQIPNHVPNCHKTNAVDPNPPGNPPHILSPSSSFDPPSKEEENGAFAPPTRALPPWGVCLPSPPSSLHPLHKKQTTLSPHLNWANTGELLRSQLCSNKMTDRRSSFRAGGGPIHSSYSSFTRVALLFEFFVLLLFDIVGVEGIPVPDCDFYDNGKINVGAPGERTCGIRQAVDTFVSSGSTGNYGPISEWDVSQVTDMSWLFYQITFNADLSKWDVSSVTSMLLSKQFLIFTFCVYSTSTFLFLCTNFGNCSNNVFIF